MRAVLPPTGRISTTPAVISSSSTPSRAPARSLTFNHGDRTPPTTSSKTPSLIPRPVSQKKATRKPSRLTLSTKNSFTVPPEKRDHKDVKVKPPLPVIASTLEDAEVKKDEEPPPPAEGERNEIREGDQEDVGGEDLDRTLQQDMIAEELNEMANIQPPEGFVAVTRSLETIVEDARCKIVCKQEFVAAPPGPATNTLDQDLRRIVSEAAKPRTSWVMYCSLVLLIVVLLLVASLTLCTVIINYDRLKAIWDPSYVVEIPVSEVPIEDVTGFGLWQRWLSELWLNLVNFLSTGKGSSKRK